MQKPRSRFPKRWHNMNGTLCHLVCLWVDGDVEIVVYKWWRKRKQYWKYDAQPASELRRELEWVKRKDKE